MQMWGSPLNCKFLNFVGWIDPPEAEKPNLDDRAQPTLLITGNSVKALIIPSIEDRQQAFLALVGQAQTL